MLSRQRCLSRLLRMFLPWLLMAQVCLAPMAGAQTARVEIVPIQSATLTDQEFLAGRQDGKPVTIAGELRLPRTAAEHVPLVILLHGSGGVTNAMEDWEQELLGMGVATFVLDSFTGRGVVTTVNDQAQLGRLVQTVDAYRALELLSRHPRIIPDKVMLMGFSRGGQNALYASLKRFQRLHASPPTPQFAAYVAFYPDCSYTYLEDEDLAAKPVRIFHGDADNYNPVAPCKAYVERLRAAGKDVRLTEYPGAHHVFDARELKQPRVLQKHRQQGIAGLSKDKADCY